MWVGANDRWYYANFDDAKADCDRGILLNGNIFEVRVNSKRVYPE